MSAEVEQAARFWAVDLHTHTPASRDVNSKVYGASTAKEVVEAAVSSGLDAIAVTDHNTTAWCDQVANAATGTSLVVLPGVEISTAEGHLLGIWDESTPSTVINELLVLLGIKGTDFGKLDIAANVGFAEAARKIVECGGIAVAAHIDRPRGLLELKVADHLRKTLLDPCMSAVEIVDTATATQVANKVGDERLLACLRGSDATSPGKSIHVVAGIGSRRSWIKAARPDLIGIKHALADPELRIRLEEPQASIHPWIQSVSVHGAFMRESFHLAPDLNCLLGGTGAGKSLVLESVRYALDQQVDGSAFPAIWKEVEDRLGFGLGVTGAVRVEAAISDERYAFERAYAPGGASCPQVFRAIGDQWAEVDLEPKDVLQLAAFSQGEILEFSREPVGRMSLIDQALDLTKINAEEGRLLAKLRTNAKELLKQRDLVAKLREQIEKEEEVARRVAELSDLFGKEVVTQQEGWRKEAAKLEGVGDKLPDVSSVSLSVPKIASAEITGNEDLFAKVSTILSDLDEAVAKGMTGIRTAVETASSSLAATRSSWDARFTAFKAKLDEELEKVGDGASLVVLRRQLEERQGQLQEILNKKVELDEEAMPRLDQLTDDRDGLLKSLLALRDQRRELRRKRVAELNGKMAGIVKLDVPSHPDKTLFSQAMNKLKVGSHLQEPALKTIVTYTHPFQLGRSFLAGDLQSLVKVDKGIELTNLARLLSNIEDKDLWPDLLEAQVCDTPDRLEVKFRKSDDKSYAAIENLAHGQKCTAILVILLADGSDPVVIDQPEDALHAPWIEEHLVDRLRGLRGERQYIFATRSPGIVVGADAEQIITMRATAGKGEIEATGSLERHNLNMLALHHLEGGAVAFRRRSGKLAPSVQ